jgi:murein DD-endopeptidase MepM/ murein hydrolase activator NlpD
LRKRYYIMLVARDGEGQLRKIPIPLHYLYVFLSGAVIGMLTITGMAGSYARMLWKVSHFNQLRSQTVALKTQYNNLEKVAQEKEIQVASLGSLANEVSAMYGLKSDPTLSMASAQSEFTTEQLANSIGQLHALKSSAMNGVATIGIAFSSRNASVADWVRMAKAPTLWPVEGMITGAFGERIDPFNGEGAFHSGVDISSTYGHPVIAPADGVVTFADIMAGYGRMVVVEHGNGISTRYGHLSGCAVTVGQTIQRGDTIGYVGLSGRSTGPHLHYEVRIHDAPVNPHKYLRTTFASVHTYAGGS